MQIHETSAVVTGGASGLGEAVVRRLSAAGAKVAIIDLNRELGQRLAESIGGVFIETDVTDELAVERALDAAEEVNGLPRILVNCAGIGAPAKAINRDGTALPLQKFNQIINVNLTGSFNVLSKFAARLHVADALGEERGVIINTASVAAFDGQVGQPAYAASKAGIVGMTLPLAREFARYGIRVMTVAPGIFLTPLLATLPEEAQVSLGQQVPFPSRLGQPDEFAQLVEAIVVNPMLNGEVIRLDGAIRMAPR
ncbi:SDR family NAD(P)-dependent oxidoreductase [Pseudomonas sp. BN414]|uniref:SDR family NAD(P)-dependent oxidoreductase n=1 Tax=unclassified Pseudomonas TaxID=196821 RepID=UPI0024579B74|nr:MULTISPECIES: SDR family NAD(P)-dependent oxidoreductase [unclassified Pseudomonas]MDH4561236.1 SDR family NAD(P)-dependent oxidoreductase [Pseudomonas sp. BN411]MDH4565461.1 SDR family NAD(P)-dependent oxidoreductase [Pseudomonas sp. BN414]MDH4656964.1 SDR family NAD(P)-dependent oxidoreductase [Pseudomonas sp. BN606]MDH4874479.1 SDR family NAD(P)-dependent oxidoreductase [Pseudomonas sp. BN515]